MKFLTTITLVLIFFAGCSKDNTNPTNVKYHSHYAKLKGEWYSDANNRQIKWFFSEAKDSFFTRGGERHVYYIHETTGHLWEIVNTNSGEKAMDRGDIEFQQPDRVKLYITPSSAGSVLYR